jgi:tetratricopeptide (TPR) repeat protein
MDPNNRGALYNKGNALGKLGNYNAALSSFDKVLSLNATDSTALKSKQDIQAKLNKQRTTPSNIGSSSNIRSSNNIGSSSNIGSPSNFAIPNPTSIPIK